MYKVAQSIRIQALILAVAVLAAAAESTATADRQEIEAATDGEWLTLTGTVSEVTGEQFKLDYGRDTIPVEMDDHDWRNENTLESGDRVTVSGRMDKDFFEDRKIEARTVYVTSKGEIFLADATDEEQMLNVPFVYPPMRKDETRRELQEDEWVSLTGKVADIGEENLTLDVGTQEYEVDTGALAYRRFDTGSARRIRTGDRVIVFGAMDDGDLFEDRQIEASSITKLSEAD